MPELGELVQDEELETTQDLSQLLESENILDTLIEELGEQEIKTLGANLKQDYDNDFLSVKPFIEQQMEGRKLALQHAEIKNIPWEKASNVKHPLITIAGTQFGARAYPAIIPGINVVKTKISATVKDTRELSNRARRIATHMDYQLLEEMNNWEGDMDRMLSALLPTDGTAFKKTYYDPDRKLVVSDLITFDELIVDFDADSLEKAYRKSHKLWYTKNQVTEMVNSGWFNEIEVVDPVELKPSEVKSEVFKRNRIGIDDATQDLFIEMHTWKDFDNDGYEEPWIIIFYHLTGQVVRINAGFEPQGVTQDDFGNIIRIKAIPYFTKYGFLPNPESGIYDLGFNILLRPLVEAMNTLINQLIDAGSLNNLQAGFISKSFQIRGGAQRFKPGMWKTVNVFGDDIRKGLFPLPTKEPSNVLFSLLGFIEDAANNVASVKDILLGENPGQNQKVGTTNAVLEQGLKTFTAIYKRTHRSLKSELRQIYRLNALFLDEKRYFQILGQEEREEVGKEDYSDDIQIIPVSDANIATDSQARAKVEGLFKYLELGTVNRFEVTKRGLEAENQPDVEILMKLPPPQLSFEEEMAKAELQLKAKESRQEFEMELFKARVAVLEALGKIEHNERQSALQAAEGIANVIQENIKADLELRRVEQEKQESKVNNKSTNEE